jgi:heat-inducible transcriptional repressor
MELTERQQAILRAILAEHVKTAEPVGSHLLVEKRRFDLSPASIRNEMAALEEQGFLAQPHTSAGRIPTVKAYRYSLTHFVKNTDLSRHDKDAIRRVSRSAQGTEARAKALAKTVAELCANTVIIGFSRHDVYYTGLTNLFQQPEFAERMTVLSISEVVDHLDDVIDEMFDAVQDEPRVLLGRENPFGDETGVLLAKVHPRSSEQLFGILGPLRMAYDHHLAVLRYTKDCLEHAYA